MISTVTTSTIAAISDNALAMAVTVVVCLTLLALLIQKEVLSVSDSPRARTLSRVMTIAIVPMLIVFVVLFMIKVVEVIG